MVEAVGVIGEVSFENIDVAVQIVISDANPHARLLGTVIAKRHAALHAFFAERAVVVVVHVEQAWRGIGGNVDVGPAVFIEVGSDDRHAIRGVGGGDSGLLSYIGEGSVAVVAIQRVPSHGQPARTAQDRQAFPVAVGVLAGNGSVFKGEADVIRCKQIEVSVAVVIDKGAARAPAWLIIPQAGFFGYIGECSIAIVAIQLVLSEVGAEKILKTIIVIVSDADAGCPANRLQAGLLSHVSEGAVALVFVEPVGCAEGRAFQASAGKDEQIYPAIIIVINEGAAAAGRFENVFLAFHAAVDDWFAQAGRGGDIYKMGIESTAGRRGPRQRLGRMCRHALGEKTLADCRDNCANRESHEGASVKGHGGRNSTLRPLTLGL